MDDEQENKEVDFYKYCKICKFEKLKENEDPCDFCLENNLNINSEKPVKWKKKDDK